MGRLKIVVSMRSAFGDWDDMVYLNTRFTKRLKTQLTHAVSGCDNQIKLDRLCFAASFLGSSPAGLFGKLKKIG